MKLRRRTILTYCVLFLLFPASVFAEFRYNFKVEPENQLFPSLIAVSQTLNTINETSDSHRIGDPAGMVGVEITTDEEISGKLTVSSSSLIHKSSIKFNISPSDKKYEIAPVVDYNFSSLYKTKQPKPEIVIFVLEIDGKEKVTKKQKVLVRSINDCPIFFKNEEGKISSFNFLFAAFVNENHPIVDEILRKALNTGIVASFKGYQGTSSEVMNEIFAVWNALQREKVKYSSITAPSGFSEKVFSQNVRFIQESFKNSQANCIDGSALLASVFTKLGLYTELIFPPGHCLLTIYIEDPARKKNAQFICLETTLIGGVDLDKASLGRALNHILKGRNNNLSRTNFEHAIDFGAQQFNAIKTWKKDTRVPIQTARKMGIIPLVDSAYN